jgi:hypothetical protein
MAYLWHTRTKCNIQMHSTHWHIESQMSREFHYAIKSHFGETWQVSEQHTGP